MSTPSVAADAKPQVLDWREKPVVLVVDDTPDNLALMRNLLKDDYRIRLANGADAAFRSVQSDTPPDLILLDIMMPDIDGYEVCRRLQADPTTRHIPIIFLTAKSEVEDEALGLSLGAVDYVTKPVVPAIVLARVKTHLAQKRVQDFLRDQNEFLESEVRQRMREVTALQDVTISALASLAETRDSDTGNHIRRTQHYVKLLACALRDHPRFRAVLDSEQVIDTLFKTAPLHDIGKVGIPDRILLKPGPLDADEMAIMKTHTTLGRDALLQAEQELGMALPFLRFAKDIAYCHQEKWDGSGYPQGLVGEAIPVSARLMAVADVYDALISRRVYKPAMPFAQAAEVIAAGAGTHFDPAVVAAFLGLRPQFEAVAERYADAEQDLARKAEYQRQATGAG